MQKKVLSSGEKGAYKKRPAPIGPATKPSSAHSNQDRIMMNILCFGQAEIAVPPPSSKRHQGEKPK